MSEDSVKINGLVQVILFLIFGLIYMALLYTIAATTKSDLLNTGVLTMLADSTSEGLKKHDPKAAHIIFITGVIFLSTISGMLISDFAKKFSIINLILFLVITVVDFVPIKLILAGNGIV